MKMNKKYQQEREKVWGTIKIKRATIFLLKGLEGELSLHTYEDVLAVLIKSWRKHGRK